LPVLGVSSNKGTDTLSERPESPRRENVMAFVCNAELTTAIGEKPLLKAHILASIGWLSVWLEKNDFHRGV
jgi:hypothetical protein